MIWNKLVLYAINNVIILLSIFIATSQSALYADLEMQWLPLWDQTTDCPIDQHKKHSSNSW